MVGVLKFRIIAGGFDTGRAGEYSSLNSEFVLPLSAEDPQRRWWRTKKTLKEEDIEDIRPLTEQDFTSGTGMIGWGVAGAVVAGPLGAIAGGVLGGKKNDVVFGLKLKDGRKLVGQIKKSRFVKMAKPFLDRHAAEALKSF